MLKLGECDNCTAERPLRVVYSPYGEGSFCAICRGGTEKDLEEEFLDLEEENG
jgi:hypothetical protein